MEEFGCQRQVFCFLGERGFFLATPQLRLGPWELCVFFIKNPFYLQLEFQMPRKQKVSCLLATSFKILVTITLFLVATVCCYFRDCNILCLDMMYLVHHD